MEAIILAGGFGRRLRQAVPNVPKPMAPIAGRPFLEILLSSLAKKGFSKVVLSVGFKSECISKHFGTRFAGIDLAYVIENSPLGTGGGARLALESCSEDHVFIFNGDTYLDLEINLLVKQWKNHKYPTAVGKIVEDGSRYGCFLTDGIQITSIEKKKKEGSRLINAGCYLLPKNALEKFPLNQKFSLENDYLSQEVVQSYVEVFISRGTFIDIGIPEDYYRAQIDLLGI